MSGGNEIVGILFIGIFLCFILLMILYQIISSKNDYYKKYYEREILCIPSGEIIKISGNNWDKLIKKNQIKYNNKSKYYEINDNLSKYKLNRKII